MAHMKSLFKWLLIASAALVVLLVALVIAVTTLVDPAQYRALVTDAVEQATGRALSLDGEVALKFLPCCAVKLQQATLGNPPGMSGEPFLRVDSAELAIRLWPLLTKREVEIGTVKLDGLAANLVGLKNGSNNWTFGSDAAPGAEGAASSTEVARISVGGVSIRDASVSYSDEADGSRYRLDQLQLATGPVESGAPFDIDTSFRLTDLNDNSGGTLRVKARTTLATGGDVATASFAGLEGEFDLKSLAGLDSLTGRFLSPAIEVRLGEDTEIGAAALELDVQLKGEPVPGGAAPVKAAVKDFRYAVDAGMGSISAMTVQTTVADIALQLDGAGEFGASNQLRGTLRLPVFSPREALPKLGEEVPRTADPTVLTKLSGSAGWFLKDKSAGLDKITFVLDETKLAGSLSQEILPDGSKATPRTRFDLVIDALDLDRYLEPEPPADKAASGKGKKAKAPPTEIPAATLRKLNLDGRARIGGLTLSGVQLAEVDVSTTAAKGRVQLEPLAARLYGGSVAGSVRLDATGDKTRMTIGQDFKAVDFGALLTDFADMKNITGRMSLKFDGAAVGATDDELLQTLSGNLAFTLADGVYQGMDVWYEIRKARAMLRQTAAPAPSDPVQTRITALDLAGKITDGTLRTERFNAEIPFLRVSGDTTVNLVQSTLDSKLTALVFEKPVFGDDTSLADLEGVRIPLTVSGPVEDPKVRVDLSKMVKAALKESAREVIREKLLDRLGIGKPAEEAPPADGEEAAPAPAPKKEDRLKKALDGLFR